MTISATTQGLRPGACTSTNRPGSPYDGQLIYETDTNRVAVYDSTAWVYKTPASTTGSVLQVVSTTKTDTFTATTGTTATDITGLNVSITPSATSSLVLVIAQVNAAINTAGAFILVRGSTAIDIGDAAGTRRRTSVGYNSANVRAQNPANHVVAFLDSPATTSATTYKIQAQGDQAGSAIWVNRGETDTDSTAFFRTASTITVMEIAG